jgi:hypothetical protein
MQDDVLLKSSLKIIFISFDITDHIEKKKAFIEGLFLFYIKFLNQD